MGREQTSNNGQLRASQYSIEVKVLDFELLLEFILLLGSHQRFLKLSSLLGHCSSNELCLLRGACNKGMELLTLCDLDITYAGQVLTPYPGLASSGASAGGSSSRQGPLTLKVRNRSPSS